MQEKRRKKAVGAAAASVAAAGLVTGALFETPGELLPELTEETALEEVLEDQEACGTSQEKKRGPAAMGLRSWVLSLPEAVRMLVALPLWCLGWVLSGAVMALLGNFGEPGVHLLHWLLLALVLLISLVISTKCAFPKTPLRKLFRFRDLLVLLLLAAFLGLADLAMPTVWTGYDPASELVFRVGATCLLLAFCSLSLHRGRKLKRKAAAAPKALTEEEIRREARRLADTVTGNQFNIPNP